MASFPETHIIQVTNVAPDATLEQMKTLFSHVGHIRNIKLYPTGCYNIGSRSKVCYVQFYQKWSVGVAQHLTNTVFIDRALIVVPIADDGIPSESTALALTNPSSALPGLVSTGLNSLINEISSIDGSLVITTVDPKLAALGLPQYPPLSANLDPVKIEEIRRTVTVGNLDTSVSPQNLLKFVNQIGEVKFLRMGGNAFQTHRMAYVEFSDQLSVPKALQYNGVAFEGRPLLIAHSTTAIIKPIPKSSETAQKEIVEAMKRVKEAQSLIAAVIEPELSDKDKKKSRKSRSRSRSHRRSLSKSRHKRRSRSHSKRSKSKERSSRTHRLSKSKSKEKRRVVSPSHRRRERTCSRSRDKKRGASSPHHKKDKSRSHSRGESKKQKSKSRSPSVSSSMPRKSKRQEKYDKNRERDKSPKVNKCEKNESAYENKSVLSSVKNSQSPEFYGPLLPVPEEKSSVIDSSLSAQKFDNSAVSKVIARDEHSYLKYLPDDLTNDENQISINNYREDSTEMNDCTSSCQNVTTNYSPEANQSSPTIDIYSDIDVNFSSTLHSDHQSESVPGLYEDICDPYGSSFSQSNNILEISENVYISSRREDLITKLNFNQRINNKSSSEACDISHLVDNSNIQAVEAPQNISVISTVGLSSNKVETVSTFFHASYSSREKNSTKSVVESKKCEASRSHSRSPVITSRTKGSGTRSQSFSKESGSKHRSRSRSHKRSSSRSRGSVRKTCSPSKNRHIRNRSRSHSRKRESYFPRMYSESRRRMPSKRHSISSRRRSITPIRKSRVPRRQSPIPLRRSRSPRRKSRSCSYRRSQSPPSARTTISSRSYRHSSRSPRRSLSPCEARLGEEKNKREGRKIEESNPMPISRIVGANINCDAVQNYEDYDLKKMMGTIRNDESEFIPTIVESNLTYGFKSMDMDFGSLQ